MESSGFKGFTGNCVLTKVTVENKYFYIFDINISFMSFGMGMDDDAAWSTEGVDHPKGGTQRWWLVGTQL